MVYILLFTPMAKDNDNHEEKPERPVPSWFWYLFIIGGIVMLFTLGETNSRKANDLTFDELMKKANGGLIKDATIKYPASGDLREITGFFYKADEKDQKIADGKGGFAVERFKIKTPIPDDDLKVLLQTGKVRSTTENTFLMSFLFTVLPFILIAAFIYFFFIRQIKMAGKGALSFGKSKARMLNKDKNKCTFKDVAGVEEAKEEVSELVEFLKDPKKFQKLGGRIPKGILMVGAPGTGKTLLAKAIAGEADASFFNISGSDFVEMFVGVGASRVRDMFEQARKNTPCLVFIDEIDAVGRHRGHGLGGGNDEREQTLNALLVEMDGFDSQDGIIIIAATNRPDVLDPALLRPGRFDRQITVNLPDIRGRESILKVHAKKVKLDKSVDLSVIARGTPGYSGAELANLLNEAALLAARANKKRITMTELEEARDKVRWGRERRSMAMTAEDKKRTAWHEAGHALVNVLLEHCHPLHKVTIIPRGQSLGSTMSLPKEDVLNHQKREILDTITMTMGGRIAEEIHSGDISSGAAGDIQQATRMARAMVCQFGMSDKLGMVQYGGDNEYVFLGRDMARGKDYSEHTAQGIDDEVQRITKECYERAEALIEANRDKLDLIANSLLEYETLEGAQVEEMVSTGKFTPPKPPETGNGPMGAQAATPASDVAKKSPPKIDPDLGASPAPATA